MRIYLKMLGCLLWMVAPLVVQAQQQALFDYSVEASALAGEGRFAPMWFTANRYGVFGNVEKQASLRAGMHYQQELKYHWKVEAGLDLVGGKNLESNFWVHQAYVDVAWRKLNLSVGSRERMGSPLDKNLALSGGWMVEGPNVRPIPQVRAEIKEYLAVPFTKNWLAFKGHLAYGWMADGNWQEDFAGAEKVFTQDVLYHSKSLMLRFGNKEKLPVELELGIITAAQFGGKRLHKNADGSVTLDRNMPNGIKDFFKILIPKQQSTLQNVQGNHCGSWNFALNTYLGEWKVKTYLEHYFEDHSQMFWQYGRWKDGLLGFEVTLPKNRWISSVVWEGMATKDQTKSILYDGVGGSFGDLQMSGGDNYYNNGEYLGWQYYGSTLGHPFLYGPMYNADGSNEIKSSRVRSNHLGISGEPSAEWSWRVLASFVRHWGRYNKPLDKQRKQFSGLAEVTYQSKWTKGWSVSASLGLDRGNYLGNNTGGMFTLRKTGGFAL